MLSCIRQKRQFVLLIELIVDGSCNTGADVAVVLADIRAYLERSGDGGCGSLEVFNTGRRVFAKDQAGQVDGSTGDLVARLARGVGAISTSGAISAR